MLRTRLDNTIQLTLLYLYQKQGNVKFESSSIEVKVIDESVSFTKDSQYLEMSH